MIYTPPCSNASVNNGQSTANGTQELATAPRVPHRSTGSLPQSRDAGTPDNAGKRDIKAQTLTQWYSTRDTFGPLVHLTLRDEVAMAGFYPTECRIRPRAAFLGSSAEQRGGSAYLCLPYVSERDMRDICDGLQLFSLEINCAPSLSTAPMAHAAWASLTQLRIVGSSRSCAHVSAGVFVGLRDVTRLHVHDIELNDDALAAIGKLPSLADLQLTPMRRHVAFMGRWRAERAATGP